MCKAYRESPWQDVHLLAGLESEIRMAIKDVAFRQTSFMLASFVRSQSWRIRKLREVEAVNKSEPVLGIEDRVAMETIEKSLKFVDGSYQVGIPWKRKSPSLKKNYEMAFRRLQNTEQRLFKKPDIAKAYSDCIEQYISKGYIRKVPVTEEQPSTKWFLPHFPIVKPDRTTAKTRIVFYASAQYHCVSLNDTNCPGPKLQPNLFHFLPHFRKKPVALVCDIAEMYLRIEFTL